MSNSAVYKNHCKCVEQIQTPLENSSSDSEESTNTGLEISSAEENKIPDKNFEEHTTIKYLCGVSSQSEISITSNTSGLIDSSVPEEVSKKISKQSILPSLKSKCLYNEEEIQKFTEILENAINQEISRRLTAASSSQPVNSTKLEIGEANQDDCSCNDLSVCEIRSLLFDQLSLLCHYRSHIFPCPSTDNSFYNSLKSSQTWAEDSMKSDKKKIRKNQSEKYEN